MPVHLHAEIQTLLLYVFIRTTTSIVSLQGAGAFSRDFATKTTPQCCAFSRALKTETLYAPLFPGPRGAVDTNDWCIKYTLQKLKINITKTIILLFHKNYHDICVIYSAIKVGDMFYPW